MVLYSVKSRVVRPARRSAFRLRLPSNSLRRAAQEQQAALQPRSLLLVVSSALLVQQAPNPLEGFSV